MGLTQIMFWVLSALAISSALLVVFSKNPVYSVLFLIVTFFAISGHYILLNAQFLAIVNVIVYAGAIMVLFLFVVMLMNLNKQTEPQKNLWMLVAGVLSGGVLLLVVVYAAKDASSSIANKAVSVDIGNGEIGLIQELGKKLFTDYVIPFEISSVLFLSAMIGAVILSKKEETKIVNA
jgi:NADH-quinone oxidoreductase subunit J